jgi:asparagine synthase (glutamine-hydrolysing)
MTSVIAHRGPDGNGIYSDQFAWLGHRRLSIIDVAGGLQPMSNETGNLWITYNGEIFNHALLRAELIAAGHVFQTVCDTETIIHAWEQFGPDCLARFRGMFAFALWNRRSRELFCARDRLGIKPFYYFQNGQTFVFASEIKALLEHPAVSPALDESSLAEYLAFGYLSGSSTMFRNIGKLMPGHWMRLQFGPEMLGQDTPQLEIRQYWDVPAGTGSEAARDDQSWIEECRARLDETVRMRLMSDVPLGMFLSGGIDSSTIAALMKRMVSGPVRTFAVGYAEAEFSELGYARELAHSIGTEHHEVVVGMDEFFDAVPRLIWHEDEPIAWPSSVSLHFVSKLASRSVKVVLTGEGSDELFGGYTRYRHYLNAQRWVAFWRVLPSAVRASIRGTVSSSNLFGGNLRRKLQHTFAGREETLESLYIDNFYGAFPQSEFAQLFAGVPGLEARYASFLSNWGRRSGAPLLDRMLYTDQKTYLVELLMKQDQMSMSASIESRVPFLDHSLVEFAARVPARLKIRSGSGKDILKRAVTDLIPPEVLNRRKMGFPTPLRKWLTDPRAQRILSVLERNDGLIAEYVDKKALAALLTRHRSGLEDATDRIWRLFNLELWSDIFLAGRGNETFRARSGQLALVKIHT